MNNTMKSISKLLLAIILVAVSSDAYSQVSKNILYLESPIAYEGKTSTSFKVSQVFDKCALAKEATCNNSDSYNGKTVLIMGKLFYDDQIVTVTLPMMVGVYKYDTPMGVSKVVPVISQSLKVDKPATKESNRLLMTDNLPQNDSTKSGNEGIGLSKYESNISWELEGRTLRGSKIVPVYINKEDGIVVIRITVDENGEVITAEVAPGTDITTKSLQVSAIAAAKKTKFNAVSGKENQMGTITYKFELR